MPTEFASEVRAIVEDAIVRDALGDDSLVEVWLSKIVETADGEVLVYVTRNTWTEHWYVRARLVSQTSAGGFDAFMVAQGILESLGEPEGSAWEIGDDVVIGGPQITDWLHEHWLYRQSLSNQYGGLRRYLPGVRD